MDDRSWRLRLAAGPLFAGACLIAWTTLSAAPGPAQAASFDCRLAKTSQERAVCADAGLSKLDSQIDGLYRRALAALSPAGAQRLRQDQRSWLSYTARLCAQPASERPQCLSNAYTDRVEDLKLAAVRRGPYLFTRVDLYRIVKPPADEASEPDDQGPGTRHIAYPQIDRPAAAGARLNRLLRRVDFETSCDSAGEVDRTYSIGLAGDRMMSITWSDWEYCHGTPHGHGGGRVQNLVLTPAPRPLRPGDLFRTGTAWKARLTALLTKDIEEAAREGDFDLSRLDRTAIANAAASPDQWSLTPGGLVVGFDPYELNEGYPFAPDVIIPWSALRDVLATTPTEP